MPPNYIVTVGREPRTKRSWHVSVSLFLPLAARAESHCLLWLLTFEVLASLLSEPRLLWG